VAPSATIKGDVSIGQKSSVWYGAILRGDLSQIVVGDHSIVQDLSRLESADKGKISIGNNTIISMSVSLSSCTIGNNVVVGMGSTIGSGVVIEDYAVVSPGSVVPDGTKIPANQVWAGFPAKMIRHVTVEEREILRDEHDELVKLAAIHSEGN
jgi:gamma-carbonic anhydrase